MTLAKIALAALPKQPWKNGGGVSTDIAIEPEGAGWDASLWRVAIAEIAASGPFSHFSGYDRQFMALGPGVSLTIDGQQRVAASFEVVPFAGDATTECRLDPAAGKGPVQAFNLILRRGAAGGSVACHAGAVRLAAPPQGALVLYTARGGFTVVEGDGRPVRLDAGEALVHRGGTPLAAEPYKPWALLVSAAVAPGTV